MTRPRRSLASLLTLVLTAALVLVVPTLAQPVPASACSCVANPLGAENPELQQAATVIFTGRMVDEVRKGAIGQTTYTFEVDRVFKGQAHSVQQVVTASDSAACGLSLEGPGPYLVLANGVQPATTLRADLCGGTQPGAAPPSLGAGGPPIPSGGSDGAGGSPLVLPLVIGGSLLAALVLLGLLANRNRRPTDPDDPLGENERL